MYTKGLNQIPSVQVASLAKGDKTIPVKAHGQKGKQNIKVMRNNTLLNVKVQWDFHNFVTSQLLSHIAQKQYKM